MDGFADRLFPAPQYLSGLLGDENQLALQQARQQGLLGLAAGLLQAGAPSRNRTNIGQAIGAGLAAGQQAYRGALTEQIQGQQMAMQLAERQRLQAQQRALQAAMPSLITTERQQALTTGAQAADPLAALIQSAEAGTLNQPMLNQQALSQVSALLPPKDFKDLMSALQTRVELMRGPKPEIREAGGALYDVSAGAPRQLVAAPPRVQVVGNTLYEITPGQAPKPIVSEGDQFTGEYANISRSIFGTSNLSNLTPQQRLKVSEAAIQYAAARAAQINMPTENAILNKVVVPRIASLNEEAASARNIAQASETINNLLRGTSGGGLVKLTADAQRFLGIKSDTASRDDLAQALATQTAVGVRASGSGATSDLEFKAYLSSVPSLSRTEEGRQFMADYARKRARRAAELADYAQKLAIENKYSELALQEYDEKLGPLLTQDERGKFLPSLVSSPSAVSTARQQGWVRD